MFNDIPCEVEILGLYFPPLFVSILAGLFCALVLARVFDLLRLDRFFWHPPLAFTALWLLTTTLIGLFIIRP
ncbi:Protein AaeX [Planctomycetes bacterium CA13]|uniref:Protein AaeX n=2 Tax=Novipirellula herctigrandis TaxID=2527986 RepID=A0A5C5Z2K6_9BACT|nr:Protein AaeX [Planctomycetes bacterium CA13]